MIPEPEPIFGELEVVDDRFMRGVRLALESVRTAALVVIAVALCIMA